MLGILLADLAAWTYENDKDTFYSSLVSENADLSAMGNKALIMARAIINGTEIKNDNPYDYSYQSTETMCQVLMYAWSDDNEEIACTRAQQFREGVAEKQGHYFTTIAIPYLIALRTGKTKNEAFTIGYGNMHGFADFTISNNNHQGYPDFLGYLNLARRCFEKAFDYTSAIHNAAREMNCDRHLLCMITGAMAEAMYRCEFRLLKKKYGGNWYQNIPWPECYTDSFKQIWDFEIQHRHFFPKNSSLTNVEYHHWQKYSSKFEGEAVTPELAINIKNAFYTGWDDRYGLYLDDGWFYVYRSEFVLVRFKLTPSIFGAYKITEIQKSGEKPGLEDTALESALYSASRLAFAPHSIEE